MCFPQFSSTKAIHYSIALGFLLTLVEFAGCESSAAHEIPSHCKSSDAILPFRDTVKLLGRHLCLAQCPSLYSAHSKLPLGFKTFDTQGVSLVRNRQSSYRSSSAKKSYFRCIPRAADDREVLHTKIFCAGQALTR